VRVAHLLAFGALLHIIEDLLRRLHADVRADQQLLELLPQRVVDAAALEEPGDLPEPALARALQRLVRAVAGGFGDDCGRLTLLGRLTLVLLASTEDLEQCGPPRASFPAWYRGPVLCGSP
jgi:hypothetical protein